jgi:hypothetical protein
MQLMQNEESLRQHLARVLQWGDAHARLDDAVRDFPPELRGVRPNGSPHSAWELLEHLRIALWDILEFSRDATHASPDFPRGYWPGAAEPPDPAAWDASVAAIRGHLRDFEELVNDPATDLFAPIAHGEGQTILREVLLAADHNAYHLGQLMLVRRILEAK